MTPQDLVELLSSEKDIAARLGPPEGFVVASFGSKERRKQVLVKPPVEGGSGYVIVFAFVEAPAFSGPLETASVDLLRILVRESATSLLAKADWITTDDGNGFVAATSACSADRLTTEKLRNRMEACASLALALEDSAKKLVQQRRTG